MKKPLFTASEQSISMKLFPVPVFLGNIRWAQLSSLAWAGFIAIIMILLFVCAAIIVPAFASGQNLSNMFLHHFVFIGVVSMGMVIVFSNGGFDFSVGSVIMLSCYITVSLVNGGYSVAGAVAVAIVAGLLVGIINGLIVGATGLIRLPGFILTILTAAIIRLFVTYLYEGKVVMFTGGGDVSVSFIPGLLFLVLLSAAVIVWVQFPALFRKTEAGFENRSALSKIAIGGYPYVISALSAAISGILIVFWVRAATPMMGDSTTQDIFFALMLGGIWFAGKYGNAVGVLVASLFYSILINFFYFINVNPVLMRVMILILLLVVIGLFIGFNIFTAVLHRKKEG
jgi:ribose transport system permease protein